MTHDHCAVYAEANSFTWQIDRVNSCIHRRENSSRQAMDSRCCLNSALSQRRAAENHAVKVENCKTRLAMAIHASNNVLQMLSTPQQRRGNLASPSRDLHYCSTRVAERSLPRRKIIHAQAAIQSVACIVFSVKGLAAG
jgi:hypothetical protein